MWRTFRSQIGAAVLAVLVGAPLAEAQQRLLSIDDIYDPATRVNFSGNASADVRWVDGTRYLVPRASNGGTSWIVVDAATGSERTLFEAEKMEAALARLPGVNQGDARRAARSRGIDFDSRYASALATIGSDLYLYTFSTDTAVRLTTESGDEDLASFSPNGALVAFVRANDLYTVDISSQREQRLTSDGSAKILNGVLDWVYEEEIYGRGDKTAYWWSPDSTLLAFLRIDDTPVPDYVTVDDIPYDQTIETWDWPKAGDPNPLVTLGVVPASGGTIEWAGITRYPAANRLITSVGWSPDSQRLVFLVTNRTQTWLDLNHTDRADVRTSQTIFHEKSKAFLDPGDYRLPTWLADGSFLWLSDTSGWRHVFHYSAKGTLIRQVTSGKWEVRSLHGIDETNGWIYFSGTERSPIGGDVYRVKLDGTRLSRLSKAAGTHSARFSPSFAYFVDTWSDISTPPQVWLRKGDGGDVRAIDENKVPVLKQYKLSTPEFVQVPARDGFVMEAMILRPPDFDASRRYPVYQLTYGGPHSQTVRNSWRGSEGMYHQLLAQKGVIVWICDNRTASGKGAESVWPLYRNFGALELQDIEDCLSWLKRQPGVDGSRIGIHGWSYGGFMTSYALTHSTSFAMGIAGGTVSDWRNYDTVYTERYMGTPEDNPDGYRASSPRWSAKNLHGQLLLIHGGVDDNVHVANTMQFAYELQKAQKPFRLMLYPKSRHGITDPAQIHHLRTMMFNFILETLKP